MDLKAIRRWFWLGMMAVPVMFCSSDIALAEMHIFSAPDGRAIEAEIVSYDAHTGLVVLERMDGKRVKINPSGFVEPDQKYVTGWVAVNAFLADDILEIECDDRQVNEWKEKETKTIRYTNGQNETGFIHNIIKYEQIAHDFTFKNKGATSMEGLALEYCIYYEQSSMTEFDAKPEVELKTLYGTIKLPEIEAKNEITVSTEPVKIYEDDINPIPRLRGDQRRPGKGEVIGICARLIFKNGDQKSVREIRKPHSLLEEEYPWTTISSPNKRPPSKTQ